MIKKLFLVLAQCLVLNAATYYVDYSTGNDANNGTSTATPWKHSIGDPNATGTPAATALVAGDKLKFKGGVAYMGSVAIAYSGTQANPIVLDGNSANDWGTGKAIIDCNYVINTWCIRINNDVSHVKVDGFELRNAGGYADNDPVVIAAANGDYGNSTGAVRAQTPGWGLYLNGRNTNIYAANLYIHNIGQWRATIGWDGRSVCGVGILTYSPDSLTITNCEITKVGASGIGLYSTTAARNVTITDSYLHDDIPQWGMDVAPTGISALFENINITKSRFIDLWSDWTGTPDDPNGTGTQSPHQNYIFFRTAANVSTWNNVNVSRSLFSETSDTHTGGGGTGAIFISTGPSVNIYNNVFARNWSYTATIPIYYDVPSAMTQVVRIYNNTFFKGATTVAIQGNTVAGKRSVYIENNIFLEEAGALANAVFVTAANSLNYPVTMDYNIYYTPSWTAAQKYVAILGPYSTLATLQSNGWEAHGRYVNPGLVDPFNTTPTLRDFSLAADSPAIGAGDDLSTYLTTDYTGATRTSKDIGAYTIGGGGSTGATVIPSSTFTSGAITATGGVTFK